MADYPLEFYRRSEQQWRRRTIRPLAPIEDAETPMRRSNQCPQCCISGREASSRIIGNASLVNLIGTPPFGRRFHPVYPRRTRRRESKILQHHSRTSDRQRLRGIELSITAPRTFRARVNHYAAMRAALKTLPSPTVRQAQPVSG